jgi:hypothetical protein
MTRALLKVAELAAFAGIAATTHVYVARRRRPLIDALEVMAGDSMRSVIAVADVVSGLLYLAFAAVFVPSSGVSPVAPGAVEAVLDAVAAFALLVALALVVGHLLLYRVAHHLEPWPPQPLVPEPA